MAALGPPYHPETDKPRAFITKDFGLPGATIDDARSAIFCPLALSHP